MRQEVFKNPGAPLVVHTRGSKAMVVANTPRSNSFFQSTQVEFYREIKLSVTIETLEGKNRQKLEGSTGN